MRIVAILFATVTSLSAFASTKGFEIQIKEISINGNLMPNNRTFTVKPNKSEVISQSMGENGANTIIEIMASDNKSDDGILTKFTISEEDHGSRKILGKPQIIAKPGEEAQISEGKDGETPLIKVAIVAKRVQ